MGPVRPSYATPSASTEPRRNWRLRRPLRTRSDASALTDARITAGRTGGLMWGSSPVVGSVAVLRDRRSRSAAIDRFVAAPPAAATLPVRVRRDVKRKPISASSASLVAGRGCKRSYSRWPRRRLLLADRSRQRRPAQTSAFVANQQRDVLRKQQRGVWVSLARFYLRIVRAMQPSAARGRQLHAWRSDRATPARLSSAPSPTRSRGCRGR